MDLACRHLYTIMRGKDDKGDQPSGGQTTWTNTGATRYGRGQHKTTGFFGDGMLRPSPNQGTQRLPNDDDEMMNELLILVKIDANAFFIDVNKLFIDTNK